MSCRNIGRIFALICRRLRTRLSIRWPLSLVLLMICALFSVTSWLSRSWIIPINLLKFRKKSVIFIKCIVHHHWPEPIIWKKRWVRRQKFTTNSKALILPVRINSILLLLRFIMRSSRGWLTWLRKQVPDNGGLLFRWPAVILALIFPYIWLRFQPSKNLIVRPLWKLMVPELFLHLRILLK